MEKKDIVLNKPLLKIAFVSFYSGDVYRGVETFVHELANILSDLGHEVKCYQHGNVLIGARYNTITIDSENINDFNYKIFKDMVADVILPMNGGWQSYAAKIWAIRNGSRVVIPGQAGLGRDDRINLYSFPDCFVGMTDHQCEWAKKVNPFVKIMKISNGVDLKRFSKKQIYKKGKNILIVGALTQIKRLHLAIRAVAGIKDATLTLVGNGELKDYLNNLGAELMPGRLKIISLLPHEMQDVYKEADVFTYPTSPWESFGIVMLEAMATNLPVVASDDLIRREIVGEAGIFVNPENIGEYAKSLEQAISTDWRDKPRRQAEKFSWNSIAMDYEKLFLSVIGKKF